MQIADGKERWNFDAGAGIYGNAAVDGDAVYYAADNGRLYKLDCRSGAEIWHADIGGVGIRSVPTANGGDWDFTNAAAVVAGDLVLVAGLDGTLYAFPAE